MDSQSPLDKIGDIVLSKGGLLAKFLGVVDPTAATVGIVADCISQRRSERFAGRLMKLITSLEKRVRNLEDEARCEPDLDLLDEIVAKAVSDEDEDKTDYYASLIEYYMTHKLEPYEVRLLGNALKDLTVYELESFVGFSHDLNKYRDIPKPLQDIFWNRVEYLGLFKGGTVKHKNNVTVLGKKLIEICQLTDSNS